MLSQELPVLCRLLRRCADRTGAMTMTKTTSTYRSKSSIGTARVISRQLDIGAHRTLQCAFRCRRSSTAMWFAIIHSQHPTAPTGVAFSCVFTSRCRPKTTGRDYGKSTKQRTGTGNAGTYTSRWTDNASMRVRCASARALRSG